MNNTVPLRIVVVDDSSIFREGMNVLLGKQKHLVQIVGEAENGKEAIDIVKQHHPDVVLLDIQMPEMDGIEACKIIKQNHPDIGVIALSTFNDQFMVLDMVEAGADGYLLKNTTPIEILKALNAVYEKSTFFSGDVSQHLMHKISDKRRFKKAKPPLTEREKEVIKLICSGNGNKEIANVLGLSKRTIESYRERIIEKVGAKNSAQVIVYAIKNKLFEI